MVNSVSLSTIFKVTDFQVKKEKIYFFIFNLLQNAIDPHQHTMFENLFGERGDFLRFVIVPRADKNITASTLNSLKSIIVDACAEKPPGRSFRKKSHFVVHGKVLTSISI